MRTARPYCPYVGCGGGGSMTIPSWGGGGPIQGKVNDLSFLGEWSCSGARDIHLPRDHVTYPMMHLVSSPPSWTDRCLWKHNLRSLRYAAGNKVYARSDWATTSAFILEKKRCRFWPVAVFPIWIVYITATKIKEKIAFALV